MLKTTLVSLSLLSKKQRLSYGTIVSFRVLINFLDIAGIAGLGLVAGIAANSLVGGTEVDFLGFSVSEIGGGQLILLMSLVLLFFVAKSALAVGLQWATFRFLATIEINRGTEIVEYLFSGQLSRLHRFSRAEIQFTANSSVKALFSGVLGGISTIVTELALLVSVLVLFIAVDPVGAIMIVAYFAVVVGILQWVVAARHSRAGRRTVKGNVGASSVILEMVDNFREISVLLKQPYFLRRFRRLKAIEAYSQATLKVLNAIPRYVVESALVIGAFVLVGLQFFKGELADAFVTLGVFLAGGTRMMGALVPLQAAINGLRVAIPQSQLARDLLTEIDQFVVGLDESPESSTSWDTDKPQVGKRGYSVSISELTFRHESADKVTLAKVSAQIKPGSFVAFVGPSGAGKTTLVDLVLGLLLPDDGKILLDGVIPREARLQSPGSISYVPQRPGLVSGTIAENIALGVPQPEINRARVEEVVVASQLGSFVENLPDGIDTDLGKHSHSLSGGQTQRMGLARALYSKPRLLILDEATSALDAQTEAEISDNLSSLGEATTVIVIAHRLSTIQKADCVYAMEEGKIIGAGTFAELRKKIPMIEKYVQLMSFDED